MGRTFDTWVYVTDGGATYNRKVAHDIAAQLEGADPKIGSDLAATVNPALPSSFKPRVALLQDAAGTLYRVVAMSTVAPILTVGATLNIFDRDGGSAIACTVYGTEGERSRNKRLTPAA